MPLDELTRRGEHTMTVCNACRYCEQYCPVFPAMENRLVFAKGDLMYLANLCHNCGECLYACPYAPPHEFAINVPRTMAQLRLKSYEDYSWPRSFGRLFRRNGVTTSVASAIAMSAVLAGATLWSGGRLWQGEAQGDFYAVVPHGAMVGLFGAVSAFVVAALGVSLLRFWQDITPRRVPPSLASKSEVGAEADRPRRAHSTHMRFTFNSLVTTLRDVLTLRHLHGAGADCTSAEEDRSPWRRWFHHSTFYGFLLCFASTVVAAIYHSAFGWEAPYAYSSLPVVLGTTGGIGLLIGPAGLLMLRQMRDPSLTDPEQTGMDLSFIVLLFLTSLTGLLLLLLRERSIMGPLLIIHLGVVLALFVTLPYGKFVHGLFRVVALIKYAKEDAHVARLGEERED